MKKIPLIRNLGNVFNKLSGRIIVGMIMGILVGVFIQYYQTDYPFLQHIPPYLEMLGQIFLNLMNMCIPFLIFGSIVMSISSLELNEFKSIGKSTLFLFLITTGAASFFAVLIAYFLPFSQDPIAVAKAMANTEPVLHKSIKEIILNFFPSNIIDAFLKPNVLQVIVFACLFSVCINILKKSVPTVINLLNVTLAFNAVIMKIITLIMYIAPIGIFGILSSTLATKGFETLLSLGQVLLYITLINILFLVFYFCYISIRYRLNLVILIKKCTNMIIFCITTTSTIMCLPIAMDDAKYLGIRPKLSNFILPLGNSLNTNGSPITNVIMIVAAVSLSGTPINLPFYLLLGVYATIASFGNPGIIGGAFISLAVVCDLSGVPLEVAVIFFGIDYFLGITRVPCNILGSIFCSIIMAKKRGEFNEQIFNTPLEELIKQSKNT